MFANFVAIFLHDTTSFAVYNNTTSIDFRVTSYGNKLKVDMQIQLPNGFQSNEYPQSYDLLERAKGNRFNMFSRIKYFT